MNSQFATVPPAEVIRVVFDRASERGLRLEGSLAASVPLAPVIPIFPRSPFRRPAPRRSTRPQF